MTDGRQALPSLRVQLLPAAAGACIAVLLGASGFGVGALYAWATPHPAVAFVAAVRVPQSQAGSPAPAALPRAASAAIGGPDDRDLEVEVIPFPPRPSRPVESAVVSVPDMTRPVADGWVSSHYGQRIDPFSRRPALHRGMDFAGAGNSAILAVAPGVVSWSGRQRGYGNLIEIDHGNGWITRYGHNALNLVEPGDYVKPGQTIALMGATGRATGTHLHFEVLYRGQHQNPARFVGRPG